MMKQDEAKAVRQTAEQEEIAALTTEVALLREKCAHQAELIAQHRAAKTAKASCDVSQLLESHLLFNENRALYEHVLDAVTDGWWDWNLETNEEYLSPQLKRLFGYDDHEIPNHLEGLRGIVFDEDAARFQEAFRAHVEQGEPFNPVLRYHHKDGSTKWVLCRGRAILDKDGCYRRMIGSHTDVTALKEAEMALALRNDELEQFVYVASHDLQDPLRHIKSFTQLISRALPSDADARLLHWMTHVIQSVDRMQHLIKALLELARIGHIRLTKQQVSLAQIVEEVLACLSPKIQERKANIVVKALPVVSGDPVLINQLFQNLIQNAIKYTPDNREPVIEISAQTYRSYWQIRVQDQGIGILPAYQRLIFQVFQKLHTREEYSGTGVGLAICQKIVALHGGRIWVESDGEHGAAFCFTLAREIQ